MSGPTNTIQRNADTAYVLELQERIAALEFDVANRDTMIEGLKVSLTKALETIVAKPLL